MRILCIGILLLLVGCTETRPTIHVIKDPASGQAVAICVEEEERVQCVVSSAFRGSVRAPAVE